MVEPSGWSQKVLEQVPHFISRFQREGTMTNKPFASSLQTWLNNIPIHDPVDRYSATILQSVLFGFIAIISIASILNLLLPSGNIPWQVILVRALIFILIGCIPLL